MTPDDINRLRQLAGISATSTKKPLTESMTYSEAMRKLIDASEPTQQDEELEEWANSGPHVDGEPRVLPQPTGDMPEVSLRRQMGAKGMPVQVEESDSMQSIMNRLANIQESESPVEEGIGNTARALALLGMAAIGGYQMLGPKSIQNSPLAQAMQEAAASGDEYAKEHLPKLIGYVDVNSPMLRTLNQMYLKESVTFDSLREEFANFTK